MDPGPSSSAIDEIELPLMKKDTLTHTVVRSNSGSSSIDEVVPILSNTIVKEYNTLQVDLEELPQGRHLGLYSTIILFVSRIFGSGIWTLPSGMLLACGGNIGLLFTLWTFAAITAVSGLYVYLELGSIIPRSGGTKVFLEFIYEKPYRLVSVVFALQSLAFGMSLTNAIVFGKYALYSLGYSSEYIEGSRVSNIIGLVLTLTSTFVHGVSVKHGVTVQNFLGALKLVLIAIMTLTSIYVICFPFKITGLESHLEMDKFFEFQDSSIVSVSTVSSALLQGFFTFGGWSSVHTVASEIKDPVRTLKIAGPVSLGVAFFNFTLMIISYIKVIPREEMMRAGPLVGSIFFEKVLGYHLGRQFVTVSIALSAASNVFVVIYGISRMNQEIFREGYVPFSQFMASNSKKTGTPLHSPSLGCFLTCFWLIILPPQGNSFNYVVSLESLRNQLFLAITAIGIFIIRRRYPDSNTPVRASLWGTGFIILISTYVFFAPFTTKVDESTYIPHLPPYHILAVVLLSLYAGYWAMMFKILPKIGHYELIQETVTLEDGLTVKKWIKIMH